MKPLTLLSVLVLVGPLAAITEAGVIYDNGAIDLATAETWAADPDMNQLIAVSFTPAERLKVTGLVFWGTYAPTPTLQPDVFNVSFFRDDGGAVGTVLASHDLGNFGRTDTGVIHNFPQGQMPWYRYEPAIPLTILEPGEKYWLSVTNDTSADPSYAWGWARLDRLETIGTFYPSHPHLGWFMTSGLETTAFQLTGSVVPLPSALPMGMGLLGLLCLARRLRPR